MAGNQREMERREKREQREKKHKLIVCIVIAVVILILAVMKICEININSIKDRFTDENGDFTITEGVIENNFPYMLDASQNVSLVDSNNKIGVLTPNSYTVLDSKSASAGYVFQHGYSNPVIANAGVYTLVYDQGADKYRLDTVSQSVYEEETERSILCADVSKNGTVAIATTSKEKLCDVKFISKSLEELFSVSISSGYVVDIAFSTNGRQAAVAVVSSENAELVTTVYTYAVGGSGGDTIVLPSGTLADIKYSGNNIWAVGDSYAGIIKNGEYKECFAAGTINTKCYCYNASGALVLVYGDYDNSTDYKVSHIKSSGKVKKEFSIGGNVKDVSATTSLVSVLTADEIVSYNINNGEEKERIKTTGSVKSILRLGSGVYVHRQSLVDKCEVEN